MSRLRPDGISTRRKRLSAFGGCTTPAAARGRPT